MKRKVECQGKDVRVISGRGPTPESGEIAPETEKTEVVVLFYDAGELDSHRNSYQVVLTPAEAKAFKVGETYTLTIS